MIPQRVRLKGFLCYKDEQEIGFDGNATLWMLSGLNGSGKSSIFDAVTFALFGHHRGGGQHNQELINKDSDGLAVEFDFLLDARSYRVRRTLKRDAKGGARGTQQLLRFDAGLNGNGKWVPIEDTGNRDGFNTWIGENIGLNYETFTSSVLLLQGKAEKLLDSKPEGRRAVLASIVDLERYERLHDKADEQRKSLKNKLDSLADRLAALPEVKPEQVNEAEERIRTAETRREEARAEVERLRDLEHQAKGWIDLQGRLTAARQRWDHSRLLLEDSAAIESAIARLRELREVLPRLHDIVRLRGEIHQADLKTKSLQQDRQKAADQFALRESSFKQECLKRVELQNLISAEEGQQRELSAQLLVLTAQMEKLKEYERHAADLERIERELAPLPDDPSTEVVRARESCDALVALTQIVPQLARFRSCREELRQALETDRTAQQRLVQVEARGKNLGAEVKRVEPLVEQADRATRQASEQATEARTLLQQARDSLSEITELDGAKVCRHCGQPLTPGHLQEEKRRRNEEVQRGEARLKKVNADLQAAQKAEKQLREQLAAAQKTYQEARDEYREAQNQQKQARADVVRSQGDCLRVHGELPESHRQRISPTPPVDWLTTHYPTPEDLEVLRTEAAELSAARERLQAADNIQQQWNQLKAREGATLTTLKLLQGELPADRDGVRQKHTDFALKDKQLENALKSKKQTLKGTDADIERLTRERDQAQGLVKDLEHKLKDQELVRQHARQSVGTNLKALPATWQAPAESAGLAELHGWDKERTDLEEAGTDQRGNELQYARLKLDVLRQEKETLESEQEKYAAEARCDPVQIQVKLVQARQTEGTCDRELGMARQQLALLDSYRKQREQIGEDAIRLEGELSEQRILTELLGRDRLQLYLVRQAEKQVVEYANAVLDRLSGGQLYLKLSGEANGEGSSAKALDLEAYNRGTGEKPINVAFLSGSQKFRVAVSLALGIGQYASRQHRPIESVIIDEGFGCLDSQGRQVMIQELQNLRSQMRCILLVSHQEEFAEAFADGYHFELEAGATRIRRFQK
jgi:exonuclease SbcC